MFERGFPVQLAGWLFVFAGYNQGGFYTKSVTARIVPLSSRDYLGAKPFRFVFGVWTGRLALSNTAVCL
ncbi:MAG: hypothetical protein WAW67_00585 [Candidatus Omnitrophota bacterium]